ncbi:response regulator [Eggerthella sp. HF-4214]|uniref:Response regulator n=1 Tax=Eggerthella guodeyinii TaxID=2690837 RepID=A0A6N7RJ95_9ACTN|nr:response regulator [Eggerthella guodeyinii]
MLNCENGALCVVTGSGQHHPLRQKIDQHGQKLKRIRGGSGLRIAICDDDGALRSDLRSALDRSLAGRNVRARYQEYTAGEHLVADAAGDGPFDLVFLDVYLEGEDGVSAARALRAVDAAVPIVFLTVSREHAVESYEVRATDYLMKPLDPADLERVLDRVLPAHKPRLAFRVGASRRYFAFGDIVYLESRDHAVLLHTADGSCHRGLAKLDDVQQDLNDPRFLRCHRSCLVNMDYIADVRDDFVLRDGTCVPVRVKERRKMHEAYHRYFVDALCDGRGDA